jgi:hypothetical protein
LERALLIRNNMFSDINSDSTGNGQRINSPSRTLCETLSQVPFISFIILLWLCLAPFALPLAAQYTPPLPPPPATPVAEPAPPPGPILGSKQLDQLVARVALYPDPLLAQIFTASTYWNEIPEAAAWANQHSYLHGDVLAQAIQADNLQWDPSVLALLPFPSVLNMMAQDPFWTQQLGNAVLTQRADLMDAVQRMRKKAYDYGYLRTNPYCYVTNSAGYIEIQPVNPAYIYVPAYDPVVVFGPPRPGFVIGGAIRFGPAVVIGASFAPWGWANPHFLWGGHAIIFDYTPWNRVWINRGFYVHPYARPWVHVVGPRVERHEVHHH